MNEHVCYFEQFGAYMLCYSHGEEEAQRRNRAVDSRRTHAGLRLMQLETAKILRRGRIRSAAET